MNYKITKEWKYTIPKNIRNYVIDEQPINYFDKVKAWLDNQNKFENLELLSEVASQQNYLKQSDKLNTKVINQLENKYLANVSNLNQKLKMFQYNNLLIFINL